MNMTKGTDLNTQKIPHKMIVCVSGVVLLLLIAFPKMLWASHGDRVILSHFLGGLELVLVDRSHGSHHEPSKGQYYRKKGRHGDYRPVVNRFYPDHRQPAFYRDFKKSGHYRNHPQRHHHPKHNHYYKNKHRQPHRNHQS